MDFATMYLFGGSTLKVPWEVKKPIMVIPAKSSINDLVETGAGLAGCSCTSARPACALWFILNNRQTTIQTAILIKGGKPPIWLCCHEDYAATSYTEATDAHRFIFERSIFLDRRKRRG
jgi:hypothetical protein